MHVVNLLRKQVNILLVSLLVVSWCRAEFRLGIENLDAAIIARLKPLKIGLVAHQASCTQKGKRTLDVLVEAGLQVAIIGAAEHGFEGIIPAGQSVGHTRDKKTGVEVFSLYVGGDKPKQISPQFLDQIDAIVFDLRDSGMRHYTYISTLLAVLEAAAQAHKTVVVLDSPNPLGGIMEGPVVDADVLKLHSFIACAALPIRHGMTIGEVATFFNTQVLKKPADLVVVRMQDYDRFSSPVWFGKMLSPNIRTFAASQGYSFLGLLGEVKPMRMGLELGRPFEMIVLPETIRLARVKWQILAQKLESLGIRSYWYTGTDERGRGYHGLLLRMGSVASKPMFCAFLTTVEFMRKHGVACTFAPLFDRAAGTKAVREYLTGKMPKERFKRTINKGLEAFYINVQPCILYDSKPRLVLLA